METNKLKRFATEARNILMQGVAHRFTALGFRPDGTPVEEPQLLGGGATFMGDTVTEDFYHKWQSLAAAIRRHGMKDVAEEAAYTWFNRLMAIRIMTKNGLIPPVLPVLQYESPGVYVPLIVSEARQGRLPQMGEEERSRLMPLLDDDSRTAEQFSLLIVAFCHATPILHRCFGHIADYTELLLPANILAEGGFVDLINHTDFIAEEDYRSSELIGWLYQFYIAEKKDEVFAAKGKFTASEIPAATQIFTPNWIVKYMVQNTVGRIYLDNNPYETEVAQDWKYLIPNHSNLTPNHLHLILNDLSELKVADLACGSGHILGEMFDMLYTIYINEGYSRREAIEHIFRRNLTGIDIDTRAKQLAQFALLLKACQRDAAFADCHCMPRVLDAGGAAFLPRTLTEEQLYTLCLDFIGGYEDVAGEMLADDFLLMRDADCLGSIIRFNDDPDYLAMLRTHYEDWTDGGTDDCPEDMRQLLPGVELILALTEQYHALVMNPPYMGSGNMNAVLSNYVKKNYEVGKADLATVFVERMPQLLAKNGRYSFIIPPSWMFLSTFEGLRKQIIEHETIDSLLHLSRGVFGADFGASSTVIINGESQESYGTYFRLVERTFQEFDQKHLRMLFEQTLTNPDFKYNFKEYNKDVTSLPYSEEGNRIYYPHVSQQNFKKIPGCRLGYWLSETVITSFSCSQLKDIACPKAGLSTGDNNRFLRFWNEVSFKSIYFDGKNRDDLKTFPQKWIPITKGGSFRKWYGNNEYILNFENDGEALKYWLVNNPNDPTTKSYSRYIRNYDLYCSSGFSFADVNSGNTNFRYQPTGFIPNARGPYIYSSDMCLLGYLNSIIPNEILKALSPTMSFNVGDVGLLPYKVIDNEYISTIVSQNISISKSDWDAHETSWDFEENELVRLSKGGAASCGTMNDNATIMPQGCGTSFLDKRAWVDIRYGQKMPHWFQEGKTQFVTFRLNDSLPQTKLDELTAFKEEWLEKHPRPWDEKVKSEYNNLVRERVDKWLDMGHGCCILKETEVRRIVTDAFLFFNEKRYILHALVVMPNHVHALLTPAAGYDVITTVGNIKSFTATQINKLLGKQDKLWQKDSFDRIIRNTDDFAAKMDYIIHNPDHLPIDTFSLLVGGAASCGIMPSDEEDKATAMRQGCRTSCRLSDLMETYKEHWTEQFLQLHANGSSSGYTAWRMN